MGDLLRTCTVHLKYTLVWWIHEEAAVSWRYDVVTQVRADVQQNVVLHTLAHRQAAAYPAVGADKDTVVAF